MNNAKAIAASAAMVMVAALGSGGLVAWQQSSVAAPAPATSPEIVVEYVDAPVVETQPVVAIAESAPSVVTTEPASPEPLAAAYVEEHNDEHSDDDEDGEDDD